MISAPSMLEVFGIQNCFRPRRNAIGQASLLLPALISLSFAQARAEDTASTPAPPPFKQLRYDESYAYLQDPARRSDYFDAIKFVPLSTNGDWYLTLGALISRQKFGETRGYDEAAVTALTSSVDLATQRYLNGRSGYYEVLQAQEELYPTQRAQTQAQVGELIATIQLYKALGGGWTNNSLDSPLPNTKK